MKDKSNFIILVFIFVLMAVVFGASSSFPYLQARLAPMTISGLIIILVGVQIVGQWRRLGHQQAGSHQGKNKNSKRSYLIEGAWMSGFVLVIYLLGFLVSIPLFGIAYMRTHGARWPISLLVAALTVLLVYLLFAQVLDVRLYSGLVFEIMGR